MVLDHVQERRKLVEALQLMKDICTARGDNCDGCPLIINYAGDCIGDWCRYPMDWDINDSLEGGADWRAFK